MSEILLVNPRRRRRTAATRKRRRRAPARRRNPVRRRRASARRVTRRRRRNPAPRLNMRSIQSQVMNAVPGAVGALGLDVLLGVVPIPANFKAGPLGYVTKGVGAIVLGMVASMAGVKAATATKMTEGALTVMIHGALRQGVGRFAPAVPLAAYVDDMGLGYAGSGWNPNYEDGMGAYLPGVMEVEAEAPMGEFEYESEYY